MKSNWIKLNLKDWICLLKSFMTAKYWLISRGLILADVYELNGALKSTTCLHECRCNKLAVLMIWIKIPMIPCVPICIFSCSFSEISMCRAHSFYLHHFSHALRWGPRPPGWRSSFIGFVLWLEEWGQRVEMSLAGSVAELCLRRQRLFIEEVNWTKPPKVTAGSAHVTACQ